MEMDMNTAELIIDEKYKIKPLMTLEEIKNSNLKEIMIEESKIKLEANVQSALFIKRIIDGEEVYIKLNITKEKLTGIFITADSDISLSNEKEINAESKSEENNPNIQIQQIEGIDEVEHKKIQGLIDIYGEFPSEETLVKSINDLQNQVNTIKEQIDNINREKVKLEKVEEAFRTIDENSNTYDIYEASGFNNDILKNNEASIDQYEKAKELLKRTDNKDKMDLEKRINKHKKDIEKLTQTKNKLTMEINQISDSYRAHQKYQDIGTSSLDELKIQLLCNLKAIDEMNIVFLNNNNDKRAQEFWEINKKQIYANIGRIDKQINAIGIVEKAEIDYCIDYIKEKLVNEKRYLLRNDSLNDQEKENKIKEITKNVMEEINPSVSKRFETINDLYNIENKIIGIQKAIKQKKDVIEYQKEVKVLDIVKEKLDILDKYAPIMEIMDKYKNNKYFKKFNESKYGSEIEKYNQAKDDLATMEINTWEKYNEAINAYEEESKNLLEGKDISDVTSYDNTEEFKKIAKYKNKQNEIIKRFRNK